MALSVGTRLGPYELQAPLGAGGMGEVYRARDSRLDRTVAIKVLPSHVATDPNLKQRFEREARTLAALSHPHICPVFDVGQQDPSTHSASSGQAGSGQAIHYIVMEYLEGETLAQRLTKGALPLDQAIKYAIEIADALDKAHRKGIVHRDLKPGNIMLTRSGGPSGPTITKLLDFGLAKLQPTGAVAGPSMAATMTAPLTGHGTILGTLQYMAPEQLEGKDADARTDIFAFGAVLYEMVTGKKAFEGKSQPSLIAAIMTAEPPPLSTLQPMTPGTLDHAVRTCMAKNPEERWQSARDLWTELRWIAASPSVPEREEARSGRIPIREIVAWTVTAVAIIAGVALFRAAPTRAPSESVMRFSVLPPSKGEFKPYDGPGTLSPDGRQIVFAAPDPTGVTYLWLRTLDSVDSKLLSGTEEGYDPFWSPDGRQVAFAKESELYKINISTGALDKICDLPDGRGGTWNRDGAIVFTPDGRGPLFRVPASGGTPTPITTLDGSRQETGHWRPQFLPGGQRFIYLALSSRPENSGIYAGSLDSTEVERVADLDVAASYAPPGYLLYVRQGNLMAQPFDAEELRVTGEPMIVARDALYSAPWGAASFSTSDTGILSYQANLRPTRLLFWFDRSGRQLGSVGEHVTSWGGPRISPDGRHAAWRRDDPESRAASIWISDLARGVGTRFTRDATIIENNPVWSPDGSRIAFLSTRGGPATFYARSASGGGDDELLLKLPAWGSYPQDWSPDGKVLLYSRYDAKTRYDLWTLPIMGDRAPKPLLQTRFQEDQGRFSPDGRWIAYVTDESGKAEVWVQSFPSSGSKRQISDGGGTAPAWRGDGREIFYMHPDGKLLSVEIRTDGAIESGVPKTLFSVVGSTGFAATRDGNRFLVSMSDPSVDPWPITIVVNWAAGLTP